MAKEKTVYVCSNCGQDSPKWVGKCPSCGMWNTYVEEVVRKEVVNKRPVSGIETAKAKPVTLHEIVAANRVLGNPPWCYRPYSAYRKNVFSMYPAKKAPAN